MHRIMIFIRFSTFDTIFMYRLTRDFESDGFMVYRIYLIQYLINYY